MADKNIAIAIAYNFVVDGNNKATMIANIKNIGSNTERERMNLFLFANRLPNGIAAICRRQAAVVMVVIKPIFSFLMPIVEAKATKANVVPPHRISKMARKMAFMLNRSRDILV